MNGKFQVLITPDFKISPDSALLLGNWTDENLVGYYVLEYDTLNDAMGEAFNYPDIDWYKMVLNHKYIYLRLKNIMESIIKNNELNVELKPTLMDPEMLKNTMFERVIRGGERFNLRHGLTDIIDFTIINPWSNKLHTISKLIENYRYNLQRDDLRIGSKRLLMER